MNKNKEHPEIKNIKNICETSPDTEETQDVCDRVLNKNPGVIDKSHSSEQKKNNPPEDSANPGNQYISKNKNPKNMEKNGFNNSTKQIKSS
jgi:hypothetical protein